MRTVWKLIIFSFSLCLPQFIFAGGAQAFYSPYGFFNPAELALVKDYVISGGWYGSFARNEFVGTITLPTEVLRGRAHQSNLAQFPGFRFAYRVNSHLAVGVRYSRPYNDTISFANTIASFANYLASTKVEAASPDIAYTVNPRFTLGAGLDIMHMSVEADLNTFPVPRLINEGLLTNKASNWSVGWHVGLLISPWWNNQMGLSYYSHSYYTLKGKSQFFGPNLTPLHSNIAFRFNRPDTFSFSDFQAINRQFGLFMTVNYVLWDILQSTTVKNVAVPQPPYPTSTFTVLFNYRNTWRVGLGGRYTPTPDWIFILGANYDETPITFPFRSLLFPETNSYGIFTSLTKKWAHRYTATIYYAHRFYQKGNLNTTLAGVNTLGTDQPYVDAMGIEIAIGE